MKKNYFHTIATHNTPHVVSIFDYETHPYKKEHKDTQLQIRPHIFLVTESEDQNPIIQAQM